MAIVAPPRWCAVWPLVALAVAPAAAPPPVRIAVDAGATVAELPHFWTSTGFCPPDPHQDPSQLVNRDVTTSLALIGGLPWRGLEQVRVHWLLDLVKLGNGGVGEPYNFTFLDAFLDSLNENGLRPGFELMGNPGNQFTDFLDDSQTTKWTNLVHAVARRYIARYGPEEVSTWNFESWNEPDHHDFDGLNMTAPGFLRYFDASRAGLSAAGRGLRLGGPGGSCRPPRFVDLCWALLRHGQRGARLDFVSFHRKGRQEVASILPAERATMVTIRRRFPHLRRLPVFNDEADPEKGWWKARRWRGDVTYAAMIASNVIIHQQWRAAGGDGANYRLLSNDNAFLNYHPHYFQQRTLFARFQMNNTADRHSEFVLKPAFSVMALLSMTGDQQLRMFTKQMPSSLHVLPSVGDRGRSVTTLVSFGDSAAAASQVASVQLHIYNVTKLQGHKWMYTVYVMDNLLTNPHRVWLMQGQPVYPTRSQMDVMRLAQGVRRLRPPRPVPADGLHLKLALRQPGVALVHACAVSRRRPGRVAGLRVIGVTVGAVLVVWSDARLRTRCVLTYEVQFRPEGAGMFRRISRTDSVFNLFQWSPGQSAAVRGAYRVRAVDYLGKAGDFSSTAFF